MINLIIIGLFIGLVSFRFKKPSQLKNIPEISIWATIYAILKGKLADDYYNEVIAPHAKQKGYALTWSRGRWSMVITKPEIVKQLFRNTTQFTKVNLNNPHSLNVRFTGEKNIVRSNGDDWRRFRRPANPIFHQSFQPDIFAECVTDTLNVFCERINESNGQPVKVTDLMELMTLDVLGKGVFSYDFEAVKSKGTSRYHSVYALIMKHLFHPLYVIFPFLEHFKIGERGRAHDNVEEFNKFIHGIINQRRKDLKVQKFIDSKDLLSTMLKEDPDSPYAPLTDDELVHNLNLFFFAGHDTTASTLSYAMYHLAKNQDVQDKLRKEIYDTLNISKNQDDIVIPTSEQIKQMSYMGLFIKEVMRISPVVYQIPREVEEDYPIPGENDVIPKGVLLNIYLYGAMHDPTIYPNPDKFDPERFLNAKYDTDVYMPFGGGSRMCIGMNFSLMEQKVYLTMLLQKFILQIKENNPDFEKLRMVGFGLTAAKDLNLDLIPRF